VKHAGKRYGQRVRARRRGGDDRQPTGRAARTGCRRQRCYIPEQARKAIEIFSARANLIALDASWRCAPPPTASTRDARIPRGPGHPRYLGGGERLLSRSEPTSRASAGRAGKRMATALPPTGSSGMSRRRDAAPVGREAQPPNRAASVAEVDRRGAVTLAARSAGEEIANYAQGAPCHGIVIGPPSRAAVAAPFQRRLRRSWSREQKRRHRRGRRRRRGESSAHPSSRRSPRLHGPAKQKLRWPGYAGGPRAVGRCTATAR